MASTTTPTNGDISTYSTGRESTGWWAIVLLIMIEATVSAGLIASYFYLFSNATVWPPAGIDSPDLLIPTITSVLLIVSVIPAYIADRSLANGKPGGMQVWGGIGAIMLVAVLALRYYEYVTLDYRWDDGAYGSIVWLIAGFHSVNVAVVLLMVLSMLVLAWRGFFNEQRRSAVQGTALFWAFVVIVWIPLYASVYLFPNFAQDL